MSDESYSESAMIVFGKSRRGAVMIGWYFLECSGSKRFPCSATFGGKHVLAVGWGGREGKESELFEDMGFLVLPVPVDQHDTESPPTS